MKIFPRFFPFRISPALKDGKLLVKIVRSLIVLVFKMFPDDGNATGIEFECLIYEMLPIRKKRPTLNTQKDSIPAKLFI